MFHGQFVALVVAQTHEAARDAASLVTAEVDGAPLDTAEGDFAKAFAAAPVQVDATYQTPYEHHDAMEPHAAVAEWADGRLTVHDCNQGPSICAASLAAIGAKAAGRPCKVALTRQQVFTGHSHRTRQRLRLGADRHGRLLVIGHDNTLQTSGRDEFVEQSGVMSRVMYAAPGRMTTHRVARLNLATPAWMRAPGESPGSFALEAAMDEPAVALNMDPVALRLLNEPPAVPESGLPWSSRSLAACLQQGAARLGWDRRAAPGGKRDGRWMVGMGVAASTYPVMLPTSARSTLHRDGTALVQLAAEALGLELGQVTVEIGDSDLPTAFGSGGSTGARSFGSAVTGVTLAVRRQVADLARGDGGSPLRGLDSDAIVFEGGRVSHCGDAARSEPLAALLARAALGGWAAVQATHDEKPGDAAKHWARRWRRRPSWTHAGASG